MQQEKLDVDEEGFLWVVGEERTLPLLESTKTLTRVLRYPVPGEQCVKEAAGVAAVKVEIPVEQDDFREDDCPRSPTKKFKNATSKLLGIMRKKPNKSTKENSVAGDDSSNSEEEEEEKETSREKAENTAKESSCPKAENNFEHNATMSPSKKFKSATSKFIGLMRSKPQKSAQDNFLTLLVDSDSDSSLESDEEEEEEERETKNEEQTESHSPEKACYHAETEELPTVSPTIKFKSATSKLMQLMRNKKSENDNFLKLLANDEDAMTLVETEEKKMDDTAKEELPAAPMSARAEDTGEVDTTTLSPTIKFKSATSKLIQLMRNKKSGNNDFLELLANDEDAATLAETEEKTMTVADYSTEAPYGKDGNPTASPTNKFKSATSNLIGLTQASPGKSAKDHFSALLLDDSEDGDDSSQSEKEKVEVLEDGKIKRGERNDEPYQKLDRVAGTEDLIKEALDHIVDLHRQISRGLRSKGKLLSQDDDSESDEEYTGKDSTWIMMARFMNSMRTLAPILVYMFRHPQRNDTALTIHGSQIESRGEHTTCWLISESVYDIAKYKSYKSIRRKLESVCSRLDVPDILGRSTAWKDTLREVSTEIVNLSLANDPIGARRLLDKKPKRSAATEKPTEGGVDGDNFMSPRKQRNGRAAMRAKAKLQAVVTMISLGTESPKRQKDKLGKGNPAVRVKPEETQLIDPVPSVEDSALQPPSLPKSSMNKASRANKANASSYIISNAEGNDFEKSPKQQTNDEVTMQPPLSPRRRAAASRRSKLKKAPANATVISQADGDDYLGASANSNSKDSESKDGPDGRRRSSSGDDELRVELPASPRRRAANRRSRTNKATPASLSISFSEESEHSGKPADEWSPLGSSRKNDEWQGIQNDQQQVAEGSTNGRRSPQLPVSPRRKAANRYNRRSTKVELPAIVTGETGRKDSDGNYEAKKAQAKSIVISQADGDDYELDKVQSDDVKPERHPSLDYSSQHEGSRRGRRSSLDNSSKHSSEGSRRGRRSSLGATSEHSVEGSRRARRSSLDNASKHSSESSRRGRRSSLNVSEHSVEGSRRGRRSFLNSSDHSIEGSRRGRRSSLNASEHSVEGSRRGRRSSLNTSEHSIPEQAPPLSPRRKARQSRNKAKNEPMVAHLEAAKDSDMKQDFILKKSDHSRRRSRKGSKSKPEETIDERHVAAVVPLVLPF